MHGLIHVVLRSFAQSRFGEEAWVKILDAWEVPGLDDDASREEKEAKLMSLEQQSNAVTVTGVSTAARILGVSFDDALRVYGEYFVEYIHLAGHRRMLLSMGGTFLAFLRNINHLHYNLQQDFRRSTFPFFKVEELENGTSKESSFYFSYSSSRAGLAPLCEGILRSLGKLLFNEAVSMVAEQSPRDEVSSDVVGEVREDAPARDIGRTKASIETTLRKSLARRARFCCNVLLSPSSTAQC